VISRDVAVVDLHPEHWINLLRGPNPGGPQAPEGRGRGWLLIVQRDARVVHAAVRGLALPELVGRPVGDLEALRARHRARRVVCLEQEFMRRALARADSGLRYDMDYVQQLLLVLGAFRAERGAGIRLAPPTPPGPIPPFGLVQAAFDLAWPDGTCVAMYVADEAAGCLWTSLIVRKRSGDLDLITSDLHLGQAGLDPAAWRADRIRLTAELGQRVAPVFLGCFASLDGYRRLLADPLAVLGRPGASAELVLDPWPRRLAWPLLAAGLIKGVLGWIPRRG